MAQNEPQVTKDPLFARVEAALELVRPGLQMDGGDVELVEVQGGDVFLRLTGACIGCPISTLTLKAGIEQALRQLVPEVERVYAV
jgi:Fe-S cluster biogenesis protein NfuA